MRRSSLRFFLFRFGSGLIPDFTNVGKAVRMAMTYYGNTKQRDQEFFAPRKFFKAMWPRRSKMCRMQTILLDPCAHWLVSGKCENKWQELLLADDAKNRAAARPVKKDPSSAERAAEIADKIRDERKSEIRTLLVKVIAEVTQVCVKHHDQVCTTYRTCSSHIQKSFAHHGANGHHLTKHGLQ